MMETAAAETGVAAGAEKSGGRATAVRWVKRLGVGYFIFCLIKGLVWLAVGGGLLAAFRA